MAIIMLMVVLIQLALVSSHINGETFMCRRFGQSAESEHVYGSSGTQPTMTSDESQRKDDIIAILEERLRVLEMRVSLLERGRTRPTQSPRSDQELGALRENEPPTIPPEEETPSTTEHEPFKHCEIYHRERCFTFVKMDRGPIGLKVAQDKCKDLRGELANIYDQDQFAKIEDYVHENMEDNGKEFFIVGMTYNVKKNTVQLKGGARASFVKWFSDDYPNRKSRTNTRIHIQVNPAGSARGSGMYNVSPTSRAKSALCEIHRRFL